jgi:hypothetical protein
LNHNDFYNRDRWLVRVRTETAQNGLEPSAFDTFPLCRACNRDAVDHLAIPRIALIIGTQAR